MLKKSSTIILAGILSLADYNPEQSKLEIDRTCPNCGLAKALHLHGSYDRKSDRHFIAGQPPKPVKVLRFRCKSCGKTCSSLPECIPPKRWSLWEVQQSVIQDILKGRSLRSVSRKYSIARSTCKRWIQRLKDQFLEHAHFLRNLPGELSAELADCFELETFWPKCFSRISLSRAMLLCHQGGLPIP